jgi:3-methyl-2-oxobutanoate hydroxymethyltransferase
MPTVQDLRSKAGEEPITMLTAYDAPSAEIVDDTEIDVVLLGDSVGNARLGYDSTLPVTVDEIASCTGAVARSVSDALVVADMPFLSFGADEDDAVEHCGRMLKEEDADAVKLESGPHTLDLTRRLTRIGTPVMAHLGLTPQRVNELGGYTRQGTTEEAASEIRDLAARHGSAGAFSLVVEHVPANLARQVTETLEIPTIGIGAGPHCDGQVLVFDDAVGLSDWTPPFARRFGDARAEMEAAVSDYADAVERGEFPADEHSHYEDDLDHVY